MPVHVDTTNPPIDQAAEQQFIAELIKADGIINQLKKHSPDVISLMSELREDISASERTAIKDQLTNEFEAALYQGRVLMNMVPVLALMLARNTVDDIHFVVAKHGDSIVVYFLCKTVKTLYKLGQMIVSGFMHVVFAVAIESLARTTVDVYVRADEFNLKLLCLSTPQDRGTSIPGMVFVVIYCCRRLRQPRLA